jgi:hypothetical protein
VEGGERREYLTRADNYISHSMRNTLTTFLILLAAISAAALSSCSGGSPPEKESPAWPTPSLSQADGLLVEHAGGGYSLVPREGKWFVAATPAIGEPPIGESPGGSSAEPNTGEDKEKAALLRADTARIEALLDFIAHNKPTRRIRDASPSFLTETGLDNASIRLTISGTPGWALVLGREDAGSEGVYARTPDENGVLLLDSKYRAQLDRTPAHYYDLKLVTMAEEEVTRVRLEGPGIDTWEILRNKNGYVFTWPKDFGSQAVTTSAMDLYLHTLAGMKATSLLTDFPKEAKPLPGMSPGLRLTLWGQNPDNPEVIELFETEDEGTGLTGKSSRQTTYFLLDKERRDKLAVSSFSLRQRDAIAVDLGDIVRQRLHQKTSNEAAPRELAAVKTDRGWENEADGAQLPGMDMLLWRLTELQYEADPRSTPPAKAEQVLDWELFQGKENPEEVLTFYLDPGLPKDQCWLKVGSTKMFFPVLDQLLEDLQGRLPAGPVEATDANGS